MRIHGNNKGLRASQQLLVKGGGHNHQWGEGIKFFALRTELAF